MPETMIKLFCWIFGDPKPFSVKISPDETVDDLKKAIVTVNPNRLQGIDAVSLRLWKKEISNEEKDGLQLSDLNDNDELNEMHKVGYYFGYTPPEMKIHIVVRTPESTGEISSSSYLHRLPFPSFMSCSPSSSHLNIMPIMPIMPTFPVFPLLRYVLLPLRSRRWRLPLPFQTAS
jgi:crinkler effector protein